MNHPIQRVVQQLLVDSDFGRFAGETTTTYPYAIYHGKLPDDAGVDYAIAVMDVEGEREIGRRNFRTGSPSIFPGVSIQVRAFTDEEVGPKIDAIADYLDALYCRRVEVESTFYRIQCFSRKYNPVFLLEEDRTNRRVWIFRGNITIDMES